MIASTCHPSSVACHTSLGALLLCGAARSAAAARTRPHSRPPPPLPPPTPPLPASDAVELLLLSDALCAVPIPVSSRGCGVGGGTVGRHDDSRSVCGGHWGLLGRHPQAVQTRGMPHITWSWCVVNCSLALLGAALPSPPPPPPPPPPLPPHTPFPCPPISPLHAHAPAAAAGPSPGRRWHITRCAAS